MTAYALAAYAHYLSFMILFAALVAEHLLYRNGLTAAEAKRILVLDVIYGISALAVIVTGILRMQIQGNGFEYYLGSHIFLLKLLLFAVIALLSMYPSLHFLKWRRMLGSGTAPAADTVTARRIIMVMRLELLGVLLIPLLATFMAAGY